MKPTGEGEIRISKEIAEEVCRVIVECFIAHGKDARTHAATIASASNQLALNIESREKAASVAEIRMAQAVEGLWVSPERKENYFDKRLKELTDGNGEL